MKKILSTALIITMVISLFVPALTVSANEGKIFSLDISAYSESTPTVKNGVTNSSTGISVVAGSDAAAPKLKTFSSTGGETKYLEFTQKDDLSKTNGAILLDATVSAAIANQDALTIEWWGNTFGNASQNRANKGWVYALGAPGATEDDNIYFDTYAQRMNFYFRPYRHYDAGVNDLKKITINEQSNFNAWHHYVVARKWNATRNEWEYSYYRDGESVDGASAVGYDTDETGAVFSIGSTPGGTTFYCGAIAEFNIYNTYLSSTSVSAKYNATNVNYVETLPYMNLVSPLAGGSLGLDNGSFTITFDNYVDLATAENIVFRKANGDPVRGGYTIEASGDFVKSVKLKYGTLEEDTNYVLIIPASVASSNGIFLANPVELPFATSNDTIFEMDLTNEVVDTTPVFDHPNILFHSHRTNNNRDDFTVVELEANGATKKVLRMGVNSGNGSDPESYFGYNGSAIQTDLVIEAGYKEEGTPANRGFRWKQSRTSYLLSSVVAFEKDDFGFARIKFVFIYNSETGKYTAAAYDMNNGFKKIMDCPIPAGEESNLTNVMYQMYNGTTSPEPAIYIDHFKVYPYKAPKVISSNTENMPQNEEVMQLSFSTDLDPASIEDDSVTLVNVATGKEIPVSIDGYNEETRAINVRLLEFLDAGDSYKVTFKGIKNLAGDEIKDTTVVTFAAEADALATSPTYKNQSGFPIAALNGATSVTAETSFTNGTGSTKNPLMFLVYHDASNMAKKVVFGTSAISSNSTAPLSATISGLTPEEGSHIKCFIWDIDNGKTVPVLSVPSVLPY